MKYRVRVDLSFENEADARSLMTYARNSSEQAVSINEGQANQEISFCDFEICRNDESFSEGCRRLERVEVRRL